MASPTGATRELVETDILGVARFGAGAGDLAAHRSTIDAC
jgi:hypothetical protein